MFVSQVVVSAQVLEAGNALDAESLILRPEASGMEFQNRLQVAGFRSEAAPHAVDNVLSELDYVVTASVGEVCS